MIKQRSTVTKTTSSTLTVAEMGDILCDSTSTQTYTLPSPSLGLWYNFSNINTGVVTISTGGTSATIKLNQQALAINNGTTWYITVGGGAFPFKELTDVPQSYTGMGGKILKVKSTADGIEFVNNDMTFTGLTDTPDSFQYQANKVLVVNASETSFDFKDVDAVKIKAKNVDIPTYIGKDGYVLAYDELNDKFYLKQDNGGGGDTTPTVIPRGFDFEYIQLDPTVSVLIKANTPEFLYYDLIQLQGTVVKGNASSFNYFAELQIDIPTKLT